MKKLLLSMLGISLLLLGSCAQEAPIGGKDSIPDGKMRLTVELDDLTRSGGATRAEIQSEAGEDRVNSLYLLFFGGTSNGGGTFKAYTEVAMPEPNPDSNPDGNYSMNLEATITYPDGTSNDEDYSILAIANIADDLYIEGTVEDWMEQWEGKTESYVVAHSRANIPTGNFSSSLLLMHGSQRKPAGDNQVHILLSRDVARIDVTKESTLTGWDITTVSVWNSFPAAYVWDSGIMDYTDKTERVRRHYAIGPNTDDGNIKGGLYAFENQVGSPEDNDQVSTCLIIGLQPSGGGDIEYFRVNMHNDTGAQYLRRNYAYNILIKGKTGAGENNEETAYLGQSNKLIYTIEEWVEPPTDLVVKDDFSTMSIPSKTVNMGKKAATAEIKIHTFSVLPSPSPLQIRNQTYSPALNSAGEPSIVARLDGNTLIIESTDLDLDETPRNGVIVLSYAGLEIAINVSQAGTHDHFLIVTEPDGGILPFAAYAGIPSGLIRVQASGHWTAKLHMTGFSFDSSQASDPVTMIWTNPDPDGTAFSDGRGYNNTIGLIVPDETDSTCDKFRVYTHSHNMGQAPREAFILIELDEFPDQYAAVIMLNQNYVKNLHYSQSNWTTAAEIEANKMASNGIITFDGMGEVPTTGAYEGNSDWWYVLSGYENESAKTGILPWSPVIAIAGTADDRQYFEIVRNIDEDGNQISSGDPRYDPNATNHDANYLTKNKVKIRTKGTNSSGRDYTAILRVQTDPGTFSEITLVQKSLNMTLYPAILTSNVSPYGGGSEWIEVQLEGADPDTPLYTLKPIINTIGRSKNGRTFVNQKYPTYEIKLSDGTVRDYVDGENLAPSTQFRLKFYQIYYPNRSITLTSTATVKIGEMEKSINAIQSPLVSRGLKVAARGFYGYNLYNTGDSRSGNWWTEQFGLSTVGTQWSMADNVATANTSAVFGTTSSIQPNPTNLTYLHFGNEGVTGTGDAPISAVEATKAGMAWMDANGGGITVVFNSGSSSGNRIAHLNSILGDEYVFRTSQAWSFDAWQNIQSDFTDSKLYTMFVGNPYYVHPGTPIPYVFHTAGARYGYQSDRGIATTSEPGSAVKVAVGSTWDNRDIGNEGAIVIDPKRRTIYVADAWFFNKDWVSGTNSTGPGHVTFAYAMRIFATKTAQYGSSFSDMFIDPDWAGPGTVDPQAVPAPWDPYWGENALDLRDNDFGGRWSIRSNVDED